MNKTKRILLFLFFLISIVLSYFLIYFLAEKYFFDKIFYQKSYSHGYRDNNYFNKNFLHSLFFRGNENEIDHRARDLMFILDPEKGFDRHDKLKTKDKFKVALIGDSFIYGLGVKESERISNILEKKLNELRPSIVYNFGNMGDSLVDNYIKYNLAKKHMDIDLFVFGLVEDDFNFLNNAYYVDFTSTLDQLSQDCKELKTFRGDPLGQAVTDLAEIVLRKDEEIFSFYSMILDEKYGNICVAQKIANSLNASDTLVFNLNYFHPTLMCREDQVRSEISHKLNIAINEYLRVFEKVDIDIIHAYNKASSLQPKVKMQVSEIEGHPSKFAHYQYAQILFEELTTNDKWGFIENN